jgi:outer membrane receptor protein involved in Fe transport
VGYLDAQYEEFVDPRPGPTRGQDVSGNDFVGVPRWTAAVSGEYTFDLGEAGELVARADYSWQDKTAGDTFGNRALNLPAYGLVNARLTYRPDVQFGGLTPEIAIFGKNLSDEEINNSLLASGVGTTAFRADQPRTYGVDISARF